MINSKIISYNPTLTNRWDKAANIVVGALILAFGWRVRGDHGDVITPILLFLLFIGIIFSPRKKLNSVIFGIMALAMRLLRMGWGTFVGQTTGRLEGYDYIIGTPETTDNYIYYSVSVPPWQGFFWLFIVGVAWSSLFSCLIGYQFSNKKYKISDLFICIALFLIGFFGGLVIAISMIPIISPEAYYNVYLELDLARNYNSMRDNMAFALAIIPVLFYLIIRKKDYYMVKISITIMIIFGFSLSFADLWQLFGRTHPEIVFLPFWELWEYYTGLIAGALIILIFYLIPKDRWESSDTDFDFFPIDTKIKHVLFYLFGHLILFIYPIIVNVNAGIEKSFEAVGRPIDIDIYTYLIIIAIDLLLYKLYMNNKLGRWLQEFKNNTFSEKCSIGLLLLIPIIYILNILPFIITGTFLEMHLMYWVNTISVIIIEIYLIFLYSTRKSRSNSIFSESSKIEKN